MLDAKHEIHDEFAGIFHALADGGLEMLDLAVGIGAYVLDLLLRFREHLSLALLRERYGLK